MKILFTGASSFTGMWFVKMLTKAGHEVTCTLLKKEEDYSGIRQKRVVILKKYAHKIVEECPFGSEKFLEFLKNKTFDLFCHHASDVTNYKETSFDYLAAVQKNTYQIEKILATLKACACNKMIFTGTVFEQREGEGNLPLHAISPYGLSKGISSDIFHFFCHKQGMHFRKFVIANPFGPYEEERFTTYLVKKWICKEVPVVSYPAYIRDNIPVSLLAKTYCGFVKGEAPGDVITPSYYLESMEEFTKRFSKEMSKRLKLPCDYKILTTQENYVEPLCRHGKNPCVNIDKSEEITMWDSLAEFYKQEYMIHPFKS